MSTYVRPRLLDPTALREATARHKEHNDRLQAKFDAEAVTGLIARIEAEDRAAAARRARLKGERR